MLILILFAFLAGIITILSPCILPILPIVLSGSFGSKRKPLGIVLGFILSFTIFTLFLATIVRLTGIPSDILRNISVVIIFIFGLSLLLPGFQIFMERLFSRLSGRFAVQGTHEGFHGGVFIGLSLGLIWTPCVGPIIASVITLAATSSVNLTAFLITFAYALGTSISMFLIMLGGRTLLQKAPWLLRYTAKLQRIFGVIMILTAIGIFFNVDRRFQAYILDKFPSYGSSITQIEENSAVKKHLENIFK
jgi:cytochrome c biogenesis protein CcdA